MSAEANPHKTILIVLAHPDDESFGMGGTIAYYASQGVDVHLVCATKGEAGVADPQFLEPYGGDISQLREAELACAAAALGLKSVSYLGYRDSGMAGSADNDHPESLVTASTENVAAKVVGHIRRLKPQVVITFDHVGGYHHPDHIAIHNATVRAFHSAGDAKAFADQGDPFQPDKLYFDAISRKALRRTVRLMRLTGKDPTKLGRNKDIDLTLLTRDADTPRHVTINYRSVQRQKDRADACHASQLGGWGGRFSILQLFRRMFGRNDSYTRAYPEAPDSYRARDLFAE